ncbi:MULTISPECIES: HdeD family acid-resistance protein [unclassified Nonomuraea]|uniref:HdeD family acid-resistance protein n=1 Tax=unclassified Nonomuraea TaxID=2593643 RepID=UPI0033DF1FA4
MEQIARIWWLILIRGIAALIFGILALIWPGKTLLIVVIFFAAYAIVEGIFAIFAGARHSAQSRAWLIISGILGVVAGIVAFLWPGITSLALLYVVAFWAIFAGITEIVAGIQLRKVVDNEWMLIIGGILSIIFGVLLLIWPGAGLLTLIWLVGVFAVVYGIAMIVLSFRVKKLQPAA